MRLEDKIKRLVGLFSKQIKIVNVKIEGNTYVYLVIPENPFVNDQKPYTCDLSVDVDLTVRRVDYLSFQEFISEFNLPTPEEFFNNLGRIRKELKERFYDVYVLYIGFISGRLPKNWYFLYLKSYK